MTIDSYVTSKDTIPEFNIGEIVEARERLWRMDEIHKVEKEIKEVQNKFNYYSVSNISSQIWEKNYFEY